MKLEKYINEIKCQLFRNHISIGGQLSKKNKVNLEWWNETENLGDALAPIIYKWMLNKNNIDRNKQVKGTKHLLTIGSVLGINRFDATVWGSGIHMIYWVKKIYEQRNKRKLDIRCVRGPITRYILNSCGYKCPEIYGDPAILMPYIYKPKKTLDKKYECSVILHHTRTNDVISSELNIIDVKTKDYKNFINEILKSKKIISSSLHGIILAEAYGIPAVFLEEGVENELMKFYDYYFSTRRKDVKIAKTIKEAEQMEPMPLPEIKELQANLIETFPKDLWLEK